MRYLSLLSVLLLVWLTACTPDTAVTTIPDATPPERSREDISATNGMKQGAVTRPLNHGYYLTRPIRDGWAQHHFVLTQEAVNMDADQPRGVSNTLLLTLEAPENLPAGTYELLTGLPGASLQPMTTQLELRQQLDFATSAYYELPAVEAATVVVTYEEEQLTLRWEGEDAHGDQVRGHFDREMTAVQPALLEPVADNHLEGLTPGITLGTTHYPLTVGYHRQLQENWERPNRYWHVLTFCSEPVDSNGTLVGTSDMLQLVIVGPARLSAGQYEIVGFDNARTYYQDWSGVAQQPVVCTNMNFTTGRADDDIPVNTGTATFRHRDDGQVEVGFQLQTQAGLDLRGSYTGPLN